MPDWRNFIRLRSSNNPALYLNIIEGKIVASNGAVSLCGDCLYMALLIIVYLHLFSALCCGEQQTCDADWTVHGVFSQLIGVYSPFRSRCCWAFPRFHHCVSVKFILANVVEVPLEW